MTCEIHQVGKKKIPITGAIETIGGILKLPSPHPDPLPRSGGEGD
jgi:hypothetical protein